MRLVSGVTGPLIVCGDLNCISPEDAIDRSAMIEAFRSFSPDAEAAVDQFIESGRHVFRALGELGLRMPSRRRAGVTPFDRPHQYGQEFGHAHRSYSCQRCDRGRRRRGRPQRRQQSSERSSPSAGRVSTETDGRGQLTLRRGEPPSARRCMARKRANPLCRNTQAGTLMISSSQISPRKSLVLLGAQPVREAAGRQLDVVDT